MATAYDSFLKSVAVLAEIDWRRFRRRSARHHLDGRLTELGLSGYGQYIERLQHDRNEVQRLPDLIRVTVSRFFREAACWRELSLEVLPSLLESVPPGEPLRVWSAGCCSGEEPYSLAMLFDSGPGSAAGSERAPVSKIEILATDIDSDVLDRAHEACYQPSSLRELPPEFIGRYFLRDSQGLAMCLGERLKSMVDFRNHNLMEDPPPAAVDLALCRYLAFTYYTGSRRARAAARLHESIRPGGALMVGLKERLGPGERELFEPWPRTRAVFRRKV